MGAGDVTVRFDLKRGDDVAIFFDDQVHFRTVVRSPEKDVGLTLAIVQKPTKNIG